MKLEEKLVSLRKAKGLSQMKLAEKMNVCLLLKNYDEERSK